MLGNLFGAIGALGRLLPGYVQGERQAVQDNWQDLQNYNQVQAGQLQNAFDEQVFDDRVDMMGFNRDNAENNANNLLMQTLMQQAMFPGAYQGAANTGTWLPFTMPLHQWAQSLGMMAPWSQLGQATGMLPTQLYQNPMNLPSSQR